MSISEKSSFAGRDLTMTWQATSVLPADVKISQVSAFCLDDNNQVLIIKNEHGWGLPGGHPEDGETIDETLAREIQEEAGATIKSSKLIGYVEVDDPKNEGREGKKYLQLRFFCRLDKIYDFTAEFETSERNFIKPEELPQFISWMSTSSVGQAQLQSFLEEFKNNI